MLTGVIGGFPPQHNVSTGEFLPWILPPLTSLNKCTVSAPAALILQALATDSFPHRSDLLGIFIQHEHSPEGRLALSEFMLCARDLGHFLPPHLPPPAFSPPPFHSTGEWNCYCKRLLIKAQARKSKYGRVYSTRRKELQTVCVGDR